MKDNAQENVVEMSQFDGRRAPSATSEVALLSDCRDMAAKALAQALSKTLDKAVDEFFELSEVALHFEMRNLYMDAMTLVRDRRSEIERGFKLDFMQSFGREARREKGSQHDNTFSSGELSLVDPDDLEESLAAINIANGIHEDCAEELFGIEKRMGVLLQDPDLAFTNNPLGPEVIGKSFVGGMKAMDCPVKVKLLLVTLFNKRMPREIKGMYQDINRYLVERGILEKIRVGARRAPAVAASAVAGNSPSAAVQAPGGAGGDGDLFAALQTLLTQGVPRPSAGGGGVPGFRGDSAAPVAAELPGNLLSILGALTRLQQGNMAALAEAGMPLQGFQSGDGSTNVLRQLKDGAMAENMRQVDSMTLDIVAMLFDYILDDRRIPDGLKALIGRLQIPALKVAMLDKAFFSQRSHPARRLLDRLAEAAIGWDDAEGHEGGLYRKMEELVQRVLSEFDDRLGVFSEVLEDFDSYLAEEKKRADALTGITVQVVHRQEQREIARIVAHDEIRRRVQAGQVSEVILEFLVGCWEPALAAVHAQSGEGSESWGKAIETMDELIWSVAPKREPDDRKRLVAMLPGLLKRLQDGMALAGVADATRDQFFTKLVRCHADAIKMGLQPATGNVAVQVAFAAQELAAEESADGVAASQIVSDFVEIEPPQDVQPDPEILQALAAEPDANADQGWESLTIGDVPWQAGVEPEGDDYDAMVKRLRRGTWIEFEHSNGSVTRVKVAWVSPLKGLFVFTNRLGERAMSITPAGLAEKLRGGRAQIIDNVALVDRAVSNLMERLKGSASVEG